MKTKFGPLLFSLALLGVASANQGYDQAADYFRNENFKACLNQLKFDIKKKLPDSVAFLSKVRMANVSYESDSSIPPEELLLFYDAASENAKNFKYEQALSAERAAFEKILPWEKTLTLNGAEKSLENTLKRGAVSKSAELLALSVLFGRKMRADPKNEEWVYLIGKALHFRTKDGDFYLEKYLETPGKPHAKEAYQLLVLHYRDIYEGKIPSDIASKLDVYKNLHKIR